MSPRTHPSKSPLELSGLTHAQRALLRGGTKLPDGAHFLQANPKASRDETTFVMAAVFGGVTAVAAADLFVRQDNPIPDLPYALTALLFGGLGLLGLLGTFYFGWRLRTKKRWLREHPGAGLYLLPEGLLRVEWNQPPLVVPRAAVLAVKKVLRRQSGSEDAEVITELELHYVDDGRERVLPINGTFLSRHEVKDVVQKWFQETAPHAPRSAKDAAGR